MSKRPKDIGVGYSPVFLAPIESYDAVRAKTRHFVQATAFNMLSMLFCVLYFGLVLLPTQFQDGYINVGNQPPGVWQSARYTWTWWGIWLIGLNVLLPLMFASALTNNTMPEIAKLHYFVSRLALLANFISFVILSIIWLFFTNYSYTGWNTAGNDIHWCCAYFASNPTWCTNFGLCTPDVQPGQLHRSEPFFLCWLFTFLFFLWCLGHRSMNRTMREYGLFQEVY
jgi:hypothetical protein